jgi:GNAT superfamily N-acetyltransferase
MEPADFTVIGPTDCPAYAELLGDVVSEAWPEFMLHDPVAARNWFHLYESFAEFQFAMVDAARDRVVGVANSIPLALDGPGAGLPDEGWEWALLRGVADYEAGRPPRMLCALQVAIVPAYRGRGLSRRFVRLMKTRAAAHGLRQMIAPVRPTWKSRYPMTPMEHYVRWQDGDGLPFDPWLRVHIREGGRIAGICRYSMRIEGTVGEWEGWTGRDFGESGTYLIDGALVPLEIDCAVDRGTYVEPNVWVIHDLGLPE